MEEQGAATQEISTSIPGAAKSTDEVLDTVSNVEGASNIRLGVTEVTLDSGNMLVGVITDITQERKSVEDLRTKTDEALKANQAKSTFLASMSHEIRTASLLGTSELDELQRKKVETIENCGDVLLKIINEILDFSKIEAGEMKLEPSPCNLHDSISEVINLLTPKLIEKSLSYNFYYDESISPYFVCDIGRIRQIIMNFIGNSIKFTDEGSIEVAINAIKTNGEYTKMRFTVSDTGIGISEEKQNDIFTRFAQADTSSVRKTTGTGLGLAICKSLVRMMGRKIGVDSKVGEESVFWFEITLPRANDTDIRAIESEEDKASKEDKKFDAHVLLVDDVSTNILVSEGILELLGCKVDTASNGQEAVDMKNNGNYDIIFMDCHMPIMDGYKATKIIREQEKEDEHITIIAITANAMVDDRKKCINAGMDDYITKPVNKDQLSNILQKWDITIISEDDNKKIKEENYRTKLPETGYIIDKNTFNKLRNIMESKFGEVLNSTIDNIEKLLNDIEIAISEKDSYAIIEASHSLKSICAQTGATNLANMANKIELHGMDGAFDKANDTYKVARIESKQVLSDLKTI